MSSSSSRSSRRVGTLKWLAHKHIGFVDNALFLPHKAWLCNADQFNYSGALVEYSLEPGREPGKYLVVDALPLVNGVRMGERAYLKEAAWSLEAEADKERRRWREEQQQQRELEEAEAALEKASISHKEGDSSSSSEPVAEHKRPEEAYSPERLLYFGWGNIENLSRGNLSVSELVHGPTAWLDLGTDELPQYTPLRREKGIRAVIEPEGEEWKPTTMAAMMGAMYAAKQKRAKDAEENESFDPLAALSQFDVITARRQLKSVMTLPADGSLLLYAYRLREGGPLCLERGKTYEEVSGTIGAQFERSVMLKTEAGERLSSVYNLMSGSICGLRVLLTGELDGFDPETQKPVECTTVPKGSVQDAQRSAQRWVQSHLADVHTLIRADFEQGQKTDPVYFSPGDVQRLPVDELPVSPETRSRCFLRAAALLRRLQRVVEAGKYYQVLILGGAVHVSRLSGTHPLPATTREGFVSEKDLRQMAEAIEKAE